MITASAEFTQCINSPRRHVKGRVELYQGSTLLHTFNATDRLKSFTIERSGEESKFFGYGICQKLTAHILDRDRELEINTNHSLEAVFGTQCYYTYTNPVFYVQDANRDELTNELTVVAYDALYGAAKHKVSELGLRPPYTLEMFAAACVALLGLPLNHSSLPSGFNTNYPLGANFEGTESIREALDAIAEVTQSIYYIDHNWEVTFKRLDRLGTPVLLIDKSKYFVMNSKEPITLTEICHATDLGDNLSAGDKTGRTQYIRNNPFWEMRDDVASLVIQAAANVAGLTIVPFDCTWRGNYLLEIGDKIALITKDNNVIYTYLLNDSITYNGGLQEKTQWAYQENQGETASNPATLGDTLKYTYAKVDKVNKQIDIVVSDIDAQNKAISQLQLTTTGISGSVTRVEQAMNDNLETVNDSITTLTRQVNASISAEDVQLAIKSEMSNGVDKVTTSTGYVFNETGLTVSKSDSEMTTQITEDGMTVYKDGSAMLKADHTGVKAENLHATTYMIIGTTSRFEDYDGRTGCFWIGG